MLESRTVKTLTLLLAAMTVGAIALIVMETAPVRPPAEDLAAVAPPSDRLGQMVRSTEVPIQTARWRNIVIHAAPSPLAPWAQECHFAVGPVSPNVSVSDLWRQQHRGNHTNAPGRDYSRDSIGVCLIGDFSVDRPTPSQFEALVALLRSLQQTCRIPADHVYLHSDVDYRSSRPGPGLPARELAERLIHASR